MKILRRVSVKRMLGVTLVEVIVSIVIVMILFGTIYEALTLSVSGNLIAHRSDRALELAQARMEIILADAKALGYDTFGDPCTDGINCPTIAGYTVVTAITPDYSGDPTSDLTLVTVTVTPPGGIAGTVLKTIVGRHS